MRYRQVRPWLGKLNRWILQWFCIRLAIMLPQLPRDTGEEKIPDNPGMLPIIEWQILYWIVPGTGWATPYRCLGRQQKVKHFTLWRTKCAER